MGFQLLFYFQKWDVKIIDFPTIYLHNPTFSHLLTFNYVVIDLFKLVPSVELDTVSFYH